MKIIARHETVGFCCCWCCVCGLFVCFLRGVEGGHFVQPVALLFCVEEN